ncbi:MAG: hypothetical protein QGF74_01835, partial [Candidatus Nanoarchaeia archaeon]|mgnify:CR=1 FL=1|jgi:hypothetical protein|nr:hypothetical protein [Candidatus Nanoarchaeia archaeon]|tara:strand:+ start:19216 stop:19542 length:327 start_codon:yes stop_codon:yes gene_type:complete
MSRLSFLNLFSKLNKYNRLHELKTELGVIEFVRSLKPGIYCPSVINDPNRFPPEEIGKCEYPNIECPYMKDDRKCGYKKHPIDVTDWYEKASKPRYSEKNSLEKELNE